MNTARFNLTLPPAMLKELHQLSADRGEAITTILRNVVRGLIDFNARGRRHCIDGTPCFFQAQMSSTQPIIQKGTKPN